MPTTQTRWLPSGAFEQTILYHPSEARQLFGCPGADLLPSCLTPTEIARAQTNGQLVAPAPTPAPKPSRPHQLCACDHFDWRHADGQCTGEDDQGCTCPGFTLSTAPEVYAPWEAAVEAMRGEQDAPICWCGHGEGKHPPLLDSERPCCIVECQCHAYRPLMLAQEPPQAANGAQEVAEAMSAPRTTLEPPRGLPGEAGETVLAYLARTAQEAGQAWDTAECEGVLVMLDRYQIPAHVPVERWHTALGRCGFAWLGEVRHG